MKRSRELFLASVIASLMILTCKGLLHADDQSSPTKNYRHEVFERLKGLQSNLNLLLANHQLTSDQYQTENEKIRQLKLQTHVDAQEHDSMTKEDRDTNFDLIDQISQEISQMATSGTSNSTPAAQ